MNSVSLKHDDDVHEGIKRMAALSESTPSEVVNDALRAFLHLEIRRAIDSREVRLQDQAPSAE